MLGLKEEIHPSECDRHLAKILKELELQSCKQHVADDLCAQESKFAANWQG